MAYLGEEVYSSSVIENNDNELRCWYSSVKNNTMLISSMKTTYINNCINMLNGFGKTKPTEVMLSKKETYLRWFQEELTKRNLQI